VTFLVWNNAGFREIAEAMAAVGAPVIGCDPAPPDMAHLAAACRMPFARVAADPSAVADALRTGRGPRLIEVTALVT
jgi:acetolactate synthase-1/2/3 large subunit